MLFCPVCGHKAIGRVGAEQYFCWDCCLEFSHRGEEIKVYNVELDGSLTQYVAGAGLIANAAAKEVI